MILTAGDAFLRDILECPGDDAPRLIYADWLDEHGSEDDRLRAEFIRVQCELARSLPMGPNFHQVKRHGELRRRERELLCSSPRLSQGDFRWHWARPVTEAVDGLTLTDCGLEWEFCRGFIAEVTMPCDKFLKHAAALFAAAPLTTVTLSDKKPIIGVTGIHWWYREWEDGQAESLPHFLPGVLLDRLPWRHATDVTSRHHDRQHALDSLSSACVTYGRDKAGLPPLA